MKTNKIIIAAVIVIALALFTWFVLVPAVYWGGVAASDFSEQCGKIGVGHTKEEVLEIMSQFVDNPDYVFGERDSGGSYGVGGRLQYDSSMGFYREHLKTWKCDLLFKDGFVINIQREFD
jgi:hypothetical protein